MTRQRSTFADLVVEGVAAYRLTHLVTADSLTSGFRDAVTRKATTPQVRSIDPGHHQQVPEPPSRAWELADELVHCRWCAGMWCAFAVLILRRLPGGRWLRDALALGAAAALIARLEDD